MCLTIHKTGDKATLRTRSLGGRLIVMWKVVNVDRRGRPVTKYKDRRVKIGWNRGTWATSAVLAGN